MASNFMHNKQMVKIGKRGGYRFIGLDGVEYKLTGKQKVFCEAYLGRAKYNASEACRIAGYKKNNVDVVGSVNLVKVSIKKYLELLIHKRGLNDAVIDDRTLDVVFSDKPAPGINIYNRLKNRYKADADSSEASKQAAEALNTISKKIDKL